VSKKILITGSNGQLAKSILSIQKFNYRFIPTSLNNSKDTIYLDITDSDSVKNILLEYCPDIVINCAAFTNVDKAANNKKLCHDVNVNGVINLSKHLSKSTKLVHISSDYVFDGNSNDMYKEKDLTYPLNYYGKTKLEAENYLIGTDNNNYLIFRPNVIYSHFGNNFFMFIYNSLKNNLSINVVDDQISNPVFALDFGNIILESILMNLEGLFHYGSLDILSRYDFAIKIAKYYNFDLNLINKVSTQSLNQLEQRPTNTSLDCSKIISQLDCDTFTTDESIRKIFI